MQTQDPIESRPLILGRSFKSAPHPPEGLRGSEERKTSALIVPTGGDVFPFDRDSHLLTIAPADSEKHSSVIIPNLLTYPGPVVVIDVNGESYRLTAPARREMGQTVLRLDPFHMIDENSDGLNPLDLISLFGSDVETDCQVVAELLAPGISVGDFWGRSAFGLMSGVVGYVSALPEKRTMTTLVSAFTTDDVVYGLAVVLDTIGKKIPPMSYREISSWLQRPDNERSMVLSTITTRLKALASKEVLKALDHSSVPFADVVEGKPLSIYLIIPPMKLASHATVLRLWIGTLLHCVTHRHAPPLPKTLFLLDECAELEYFSLLESAITQCRGLKPRLWTFWRDLSQLRNLYPVTWPTIIESCGAIQVFRTRDHSATSEIAAFLGIEADEVRSLDSDDQIVLLDHVLVKLKKLNYATDPLFGDASTRDS